MLRNISDKAKYASFLEREEALLSKEKQEDFQAEEYLQAKKKMLLMEPERAHNLLAGCYSP